MGICVRLFAPFVQTQHKREQNRTTVTVRRTDEGVEAASRELAEEGQVGWSGGGSGVGVCGRKRGTDGRRRIVLALQALPHLNF